MAFATMKFSNPVSDMDSNEDAADEMFDSERKPASLLNSPKRAVSTFDPENADHSGSRDADSEDRCKLWVGNIDKQHSTEAMIKAAFELLGGNGVHDDVVESVTIRVKAPPRRNWCLVSFFAAEHAQLALLGWERLQAEEEITLPDMCRDWTIKPCKSGKLLSSSAKLTNRVSTDRKTREVTAESMEHLDAEQMNTFAEVKAKSRVLCEGLVQCQFGGRKKGPFTSVWLTLESDGALTFSNSSGLLHLDQDLSSIAEKKSTRKELQKVSALWCSVKQPATIRPQFPNAIRLDLAFGINGKKQKYILDILDEDAATSGMDLAMLEAALISCSFAKLGASGMMLETEKDRRLREAAEDMSAAGMVLNPESNFRRRWDVMQLMLLTYVAIVVPFRVSFNVTLELWGFWFFFDIASDLYFIVDMFLSFQTAYFDDRGELETNTGRIFKNYFRTWFPVDFVACFPGKLITYMTSDGSETTVLNLTVLVKLLRLARVGRLISRYEAEFHEFLSRIQLGKLVLIMGIVGHWLCCLWFAIGSLETAEVDQFGDPLQGWVSRMWGTDGSLSTKSTMDRYLRSFYWAIMTMTTVGYGDIVPNTGWETVIAILGMVVGGFVFALIVGSLSELSKRSNPGDTARDEQYGLVGAMLQDGPGRHVDPALARKIRTFYSNHYHKRTAMDFFSFITGCPPDLRDELAYQLNWIDGTERGKNEAGLLSKMPFFCGLDSLSSIYICAKMRSVLAVPVVAEPDGTRSNLIMVEGTRAEEMYVVIEVEMEEENSRPIVLEKQGEAIGSLGYGDFFGELAALLPLSMKRYRTRTRTAFATAEVHLGMLAHDDIMQLCAERSEIAQKVLPFVNRIARSVASSPELNVWLSPRADGKVDELPPGPVLSEYDIHPVLKAIQPTLEEFDATLATIEKKLDLVVAAR